MRTPSLLTVTSDEPLRQSLQFAARQVHFDLIEAAGRLTLSRYFENKQPDAVVIGPAVRHPWDAVQIARLVRQWTRRVPILMVTGSGSEELAVAAMRAGVSDYFRAPVQANELSEGIRRQIDERSASSPSAVPLIGESRAAAAIIAAIEKVAAVDSNVLITGETGTGKELAAAMIHGSSRRAKHPLVSINCAAIPDTLLESELFGYERGAFTGADSTHVGRVSAAHCGTVLFDEIGDMSAIGQAKVLRLVEDKEVGRLGSTRSVRVDARIIAATNRNLEALIADGRFRSDLYFRLDVTRVHLPPLRERREDVPLLVAYYLRAICDRFERNVIGVTDQAMEALTAFDWPGNVRELKNAIEAAVMNTSSPQIGFADLPEKLKTRLAVPGRAQDAEPTSLQDALFAAKGNKTEAARALQCSRMTVYRKLAKVQLQR
jgi:DNA-binding NtrC family response regulator